MIQYSENSVCDKFKAVNFTDKVLVEVKATQQYGHDTDVTDLTTYGTLRDYGAAYIIKYNEELENPSETVCVTVRVQKDESFVEMTRSGRSHACLTIEKAKRNLCSYGIVGRVLETGVKISICFQIKLLDHFIGGVILVRGALAEWKRAWLAFGRSVSGMETYAF